MAAIQGSSVLTTIYSDSASDRMRGMDPAKRPFQKRGGTRKRLGTVVQSALESMAHSYTGAPDNSPGRAGSSSRRSGLKVRKQIYSLLDLLAAGGDRDLPKARDALHQLLGIVATQKFGTSWERTAQPFVDAYFRSSPREDILSVARRLDELAAAAPLLASMEETNRQDVLGVMAALKRAAMRELASRGIGAPLGTLAGLLAEPEPDSRSVAKAWLSLEENVREAASKERLPPIDYLQSGLERLPSASTRVLATVLAPRVPNHARMARYVLETVIDDALRGTVAASAQEHLDTYMVHEAVRLHIVACVESKIAESLSRFENAVRPGIRTAEVAHRQWHDLRHTLDALGWIYLGGYYENAAGEKAALDAATEQHFASAVMAMHPDTAGAFLQRVDTERLLAMHAGQDQWTPEQHDYLAGPLLHACRERFWTLLHTVQEACSDLETAQAQDRRIATANALLAVSDALGRCESFALRTGSPQDWREDPQVDAAILRAAATLRMPGEPGHVAGALSLRGLRDEAYADLRRIDDPQVVAGLAIDPMDLAAETQRRVAQRDAAVGARLDQLSDLLRNPAPAPRPFVGIIASLALADMSRREAMVAFRDGSAHRVMDPVSPALNREVGMMLYRKDGALPVQWMEARRHIGGLLGALQQVRMVAGHGAASPQAGYPGALAPVDTAISILAILGRHFGIQAQDATTVAAFQTPTDPYWNPQCLEEIAPFFGLRYEPAIHMASPLCGAMHRARLLAALGMRMAQPEQSGLEAVVAQTEAGPRAVEVDKQFHNAAYRRGELSLSVAGPASACTTIGRAAAAGGELGPQSPASLAVALGGLASLGNGMDAALTRLMSAVAQGIGDFIHDARDLPDMWRWSRIPEPQSVRHIHFEVSEMPQGGYRVDVSACLETQRADREVQLAVAMRVTPTAGRVTSLIVPPHARLLFAMAPAFRNVSLPGVTTAGIEQPAEGVVAGRTSLAAAGA